MFRPDKTAFHDYHLFERGLFLRDYGVGSAKVNGHCVLCDLFLGAQCMFTCCFYVTSGQVVAGLSIDRVCDLVPMCKWQCYVALFRP